MSIRNLRAELKVEAKIKVPIVVFAHDAETKILIEQNRDVIERLGNVESVTAVEEARARQSPSRSTVRFDVRVIYEKKIDIMVERERMKKELEQIEKEIANAQRQLNNEQFLAKAPTHVVDGIRKREQELAVLREKGHSKLEELKR